MDTGNGERVRQGRRGIRDAAGTEKRMHAEYTQVALQLTYIHASPNQHLKELPNTHMQVKAVTNTEHTHTQRHTLLSITSVTYMTILRNRLRTCVYLDLRVIRACVCLCVWVRCLRHLTHGPSVFLDPFCHLDTSQCK